MFHRICNLEIALHILRILRLRSNPKIACYFCAISRWLGLIANIATAFRALSYVCLFAHLVPDQTSIVSDAKLGYPLLWLHVVGVARVFLLALLKEGNVSGLCMRNNTTVAVPGRNQTLVHCVFRLCCRVQSTVAQNFC